MGFCLYQNKFFVLHASAIKYKNEAILFIGMSGAGKSSLSASMCKKGIQFITEDVACIEKDKNNFFVRVGPPLVKLHKNIAKEFNHINDGIDLINDRYKRKLYKLETPVNKSIKIKKCYFLEWSNKFSINKIDSNKILANFLMCSYSAYPYNSCHESSHDLMKNISVFTNAQEIFLINRTKNDYFKANKKIFEHIVK